MRSLVKDAVRVDASVDGAELDEVRVLLDECNVRMAEGWFQMKSINQECIYRTKITASARLMRRSKTRAQRTRWCAPGLRSRRGSRDTDRPRLLICALETGMRFGKIIKIRRSDIDLDTGIITIEAFHTKTMTARQVPITARLRGSS
jgi:Phage integrase family